MAALEIGAELDFVDGEEGDVEIARHGLDGGDPEARIRRLDLLLAGDQRDGVGADPVDDLVVDLARQAAAAAARSCRDECASMRSMARWVLPVLVGPEHGGHAGAAGARASRFG